MNQYMVEVQLPVYMSDAFIALIPRQRALINKWLQQGVVTSYSLALDRSKLWVTFNVNSEEEVRLRLEQFPVAPFVDYTIFELAFSEVVDFSINTMSLN
jgi:hypothetical protein